MSTNLVSEEIPCKIALLPAIKSKRVSSPECRYRPNHRDPTNGTFFMGQIEFLEGTEIEPGQVKKGIVRVVCLEDQLQSIKRLGSWTFWEGPTLLAGSITVIGNGR